MNKNNQYLIWNQLKYDVSFSKTIYNFFLKTMSMLMFENSRNHYFSIW